MKLQIHRKKLEELKQMIPPPKPKPTRFFATIEEALAAKEKEEQEEAAEEPTPEIRELKKEIAQREKIVNQLQEVYDEMQLQKDLKDGEHTTYEDDEGNVSYQWKRERKH
ncbi:Utp11 protein [Histomonas meleagridis]|uniref:Utp11 protein n=1 Tax=Histomonas meleagridis TaxID=135588 RepID=UPI00355AB0BB|nr:Utp11 protein [Histomonas meleagridis]KAH0805827.1 Utp11 protein [Histomonas meleagridis]